MTITRIVTYTVDDIKKILTEEEKSYRVVMREAYMWTERIDFYIDMAMEKLDACKTEEDLDNFIGLSRKMSLTEWINSLPK
jgi:hypothetical protein